MYRDSVRLSKKRTFPIRYRYSWGTMASTTRTRRVEKESSSIAIVIDDETSRPSRGSMERDGTRKRIRGNIFESLVLRGSTSFTDFLRNLVEKSAVERNRKGEIELEPRRVVNLFRSINRTRGMRDPFFFTRATASRDRFPRIRGSFINFVAGKRF